MMKVRLSSQLGLPGSTRQDSLRLNLIEAAPTARLFICVMLRENCKGDLLINVNNFPISKKMSGGVLRRRSPSQGLL